MADITPTSSTPKDMKQRMGAVKGINPDDLNDTAFELVTMFVSFLCCHNSPSFFSRTQVQQLVSLHPHLPSIVYELIILLPQELPASALVCTSACIDSE